MRSGVVGGGYWGEKHVRVLDSLPEVQELVVVDPREEVRHRLQSQYPALRAFSSLTEALPHVDALTIATPPSTHAQLAQRAMAAGCHVLVEKPLATTVEDARRLTVCAKDAGVVLMVGHTFEYNASVTLLRDAVQSGDLGTVYFIDAARLNLGLYQRDVNVLWDLAPHDISIMNYVLGSTPDTVQAWGSSHAHAFLEDVAYLRLEYKELDVVAQVHVSWLEPCKVRRMTVVGSERMAVFNDLALEEPIRIYDKGLDVARGQSGDSGEISYRSNGVYSPSVSGTEPLKAEVSHFLECIRNGAQPRSNGASGLGVVEVLAAAEISLRERCPVELASTNLEVIANAS